MRNLIDTFRQIMQHDPAAEVEDRSDTSDVPMAAAVLLLELAWADDEATATEHRVLEQAIAQTYQLDPEALERLLTQAKTVQKQSTSLHEFTSSLRASLNAGQRGELIEWLWRVAYADQHLDPYEEQLVRRLTDLIGVPHQEMMRRKDRVLRANRTAD
ncbi:MAG: TerB family tellurite resistance protein [Pseudomonadota bacterium]